MIENKIVPHMRVRVTHLESTLGYMVAERHMTVRRVGATGVVGGWVPGHGGDVWFVYHDDSDECGVYMYTELLEEPDKPVHIDVDLWQAEFETVEFRASYPQTYLRDYGDTYGVVLSLVGITADPDVTSNESKSLLLEITEESVEELIRMLNKSRAQGGRLMGERRRNQKERAERGARSPHRA